MENYKEKYFKYKTKYLALEQKQFYLTGGTNSLIIHIIGSSGSGKTTLGKKLSELKNVIVIDTDDIDDKNALEIINDDKYNEFFFDSNLNEFFKMLKRMNIVNVKNIIKKNANKIIIFVGLTIDISKLANFGYCIDIDPKNNFLQINKRTLNDIIKNKNKLQLLLDSNEPIDKIFEIAVKKYKIRVPFMAPPPMIKDNIQWQYKIAKKNGYKIMKADDIYQDIRNKISKKNISKSIKANK